MIIMLHIDTFQPNHLIIYLLSGVDVGVDTDVDVLTRPAHRHPVLLFPV
jgi:hypothetical protein